MEDRHPEMVPPSGLGVPLPDWLNPPPPQLAGGAHVPQSMTPPQPSAIFPQVKPKFVHVFGVHALPAPPVAALPMPHRL